ncbi:hypothetical protein ACFVIM_15185 [Streptomyces sp. NPDC057638]|uniref:hypothetical protein n=1 Tax=Streptomyces sp. NPDC057638 TaxID=3346190 RepID=UPI0036A543E8
MTVMGATGGVRSVPGAAAVEVVSVPRAAAGTVPGGAGVDALSVPGAADAATVPRAAAPAPEELP